MSAHTTLRVGGKADLFYVTETSGDLIKAIRLARSFGVPVTVIGEGSGVVVGDGGLEGIVVKSRSERIQIKPHRSLTDFFRKPGQKKVEVTIDGGVKASVAKKKLEEKGIETFDDLDEYAGSIAGMVREGLGKEYLKNMSVIDNHGGVKSIQHGKEMKDNVVIEATFLLTEGKKEKKKEKPSAAKRGHGFVVKVFEDLAKEEIEMLGYATNDPAYLIGEILNMKGFRMGRMRVAIQNQNTIENLGGGTAEEYVKLVEEIKNRAREAVGIELTEKVVRLGKF